MFKQPFVEGGEKGLMDNEQEVISDIHGVVCKFACDQVKSKCMSFPLKTNYLLLIHYVDNGN